MTRANRLAIWLLALALLYVGAYSAYRATHTEVWSLDGKPYLIFGSSLGYYFFRPLSYVDGGLTGMNFHIGPHRQAAPAPTASR